MEIVKVVKALADETRLKIIRFLFRGSKNATNIVEYVGKSQPNVSLALKQLMFAELIVQRKEGRQIFYSLKDPVKIKKLFKLLEDEKNKTPGEIIGK